MTNKTSQHHLNLSSHNHADEEEVFVIPLELTEEMPHFEDQQGNGEEIIIVAPNPEMDEDEEIVVTPDEDDNIDHIITLDSSNEKKDDDSDDSSKDDEEDIQEINLADDIDHAEEMTVSLGDLPGAPHAQDIEMVVKAPTEDKKEEKPKKQYTMWDWEPHYPQNFFAWAHNLLQKVPPHSGQDVAGCERAYEYLDKVKKVISNAFRQDLEGHLDSNKVEQLFAEIERGKKALSDRVEKIEKSRKVASFVSKQMLVKNATSNIGVRGVYVPVPLFITRLARLCVNSSISAGKDIGITFNAVKDKFKLTTREEMELEQLLMDMGYQLVTDRFYTPEELVNKHSPDNFDWIQQFRG